MCSTWLWKTPCLRKKVPEDSSSFMPSCSASVFMTSCHEMPWPAMRFCWSGSPQIVFRYLLLEDVTLGANRSPIDTKLFFIISLENFAVYQQQLKDGCQSWSRVVSRYEGIQMDRWGCSVWWYNFIGLGIEQFKSAVNFCIQTDFRSKSNLKISLVVP